MLIGLIDRPPQTGGRTSWVLPPTAGDELLLPQRYALAPSGIS